MGLTNTQQSLAQASSGTYLVHSPEQRTAMVAIGYARCSTEEQSLESMAIDYQVKRLEDICGTGNVIRDERSATKCPLAQRTKFWEAIERLRKLPPGTERRLVYVRIDRIARIVKDAEVIQDLCREGIIFQGLDSGEVMQGAQGTMMLNMSLMMAQYEQQLLGEKLEAKYVDRRKSKSPMNRPPFGYTLKKIVSESGIKFRFIPHEVRFIQAQQIYQAFLDNEGSLSGTLRACNYEGMPRSPRGLKLWLSNVHNLGHTKYEGRTTRSGKVIPEEILKDTHKAIVDEVTFNQVQLMLGERSWQKDPAKKLKVPPHPLQSVLRCPVCGTCIGFTRKIVKAKGKGIGRYAGKYNQGEDRLFYGQTCRYVYMKKCDLDLSSGVVKKAMLDMLKDQAWETLIKRADQLTEGPEGHQSQLSSEELQLMTAIQAIQDLPGELMRQQVAAMRAQLEQYQFKRMGKISNAGQMASEFKALDLSVEGLNALDFGEQNKLMKYFFHRIVPPYKGDPAIFDMKF